MDFRNYRDGEADFLLINRYVLSNAVYQSIRERDISEPGSDNSAFADWVSVLNTMFWGFRARH